MSVYDVLKAEYLYPGAFMPESTTRKVEGYDWFSVNEAAPEESGYFVKDGWYAVVVRRHTYESFYSQAEDAERHVLIKSEKVISYIVGEKVHYSNIDPENGRFDTLIRNIEYNSKDGYGVKTRCGNWQIASDYDVVVAA